MSCINCEDKCKYNDLEKTCENCKYDVLSEYHKDDPCDLCVNGSNFEYKVVDENGC